MGKENRCLTWQLTICSDQPSLIPAVLSKIALHTMQRAHCACRKRTAAGIPQDVHTHPLGLTPSLGPPSHCTLLLHPLQQRGPVAAGRALSSSTLTLQL